jgi:hypothetical protein
MAARGPKVPTMKLVRLMTTLVVTEMTEESTNKLTMLQKTQAIHQTAIVTQTPLTGISMKTTSFGTLMM